MKARGFSFASIAVALLLAAPAFAQVPSLTFTLETTNPDGRSLVPRLTWTTTPAAASCAASGSWSGTKLASGTEILAAVSSSQSYGLLCTWPGQKTAKLTWAAPVKNTDGSTLTDLTGFKVYYGTGPTALTQSAPVPGATSTQWVSPQLAVGTWYFSVTALNQPGIESAKVSPPVSKAITADTTITRTQTLAFVVPNPPTDLVVE